MELGDGEEFILVKVSKDKRKCWATFLADDPERPYVDAFTTGSSIRMMLERRNLEKTKREEKEKQRKADEFFNRWALEPGEKDSTCLRPAFKSTPRSPPVSGKLTLRSPPVSGKPPAEPKDDESEAVRERARESRTIATWGGGAYHWSHEFRDELKAEGDSWEEKRIASERSTRNVGMAGGASPPRKVSLANMTFLDDDIDDPHGDFRRMGKMDPSSASYSPKGYTKNNMPKIKNLIEEGHASEGECITVDNFDPNCTAKKKPVRKGRSNKRKKGKNIERPQPIVTHPSLEAMDSDVLQEMAGKMISKFAVDDKVRFEGEDDDAMWIYGIVQEVIPPGDPRNPLEDLRIMYLMIQMDDSDTIVKHLLKKGASQTRK